MVRTVHQSDAAVHAGHHGERQVVELPQVPLPQLQHVVGGLSDGHTVTEDSLHGPQCLLSSQYGILPGVRWTERLVVLVLYPAGELCLVLHTQLLAPLHHLTRRGLDTPQYLQVGLRVAHLSLRKPLQFSVCFFATDQSGAKLGVGREREDLLQLPLKVDREHIKLARIVK